VSRRYHQFCPIARVLDVVGERWTLLIVRELLLGPRRFTDLAAGLPGIGTSVLTTRLKQLEHDGLVRKQILPAPAASVVYELTPSSLGLIAILGAMANWGMNLLGRPGPDDRVQARWLVLCLAVTAKGAHSVPDAAYELHIDDEIFHIRAQDGQLAPAQGPTQNPEATIAMSTDALVAIANGELDIPSPRATRLITIDGATPGAEQLLRALAASAPRNSQPATG
jgi:DNA-binding HxlR family transcriptional regulator